MALTFQAPDNSHAIGTFFKGSHDMNHVDLSGAWNPYDLDIGRILQSHRTCQVRRRVPSEIAAKRNNNRIKIFAHCFSSLIKMTKFRNLKDTF